MFFTSRVAFANEILVEDGSAKEEKEDFSELLLKTGNWGDPICDGLIPPWGIFTEKFRNTLCIYN